jgi:serine/threonine-protein phosphatase 2A regulatory subunit A
MDSTNPIDVLKEEMDNEEVSMRVNAIHRLRIVATLIGSDKIKS